MGDVKRMSRAAAVLLWASGAVAVHAALPYGLSRLNGRARMRRSTPLALRYTGLLAVTAGAALVAWALASHYEAAPRGWPIPPAGEVLSRAPHRLDYLLRKGPYRLTRNPMYVGEVVVWLGWALFYGSWPVGAGLALICAILSKIVPWEERRLFERFGDDYHAYFSTVPRWVRIGSMR